MTNPELNLEQLRRELEEVRSRLYWLTYGEPWRYTHNLSVQQLIERKELEKRFQELNKQIEPLFRLVLFSKERLTPQFLATSLSPFLVAISNIQAVIDEAQGRNFQEVAIESITQHSPINVSFEGVVKALEILTSLVVPWMKSHQINMARLEEQKREAEIEKAKIENEKAKFEINRERLQLAIEIISKISPFLPEEEKTAFANKLLPDLDVVISSGFEIRQP